jgi:PAS domain S-box-containing protein
MQVPSHKTLPGELLVDVFSGSDRNFRTVFELSGTPLLVVESASLRILGANSAACGRLARTAAELVRLRLPDVFEMNAHGPLPDTATWRVAASAAGKSRLSVSARALESDGANVHLLALTEVPEPPSAAHGNPVSGRFLETVLDSLPQPVFVKDARHRWILLNRAYCEIVGGSREALLGRSDPDFYPPQLASRFWAEDDRALATDHAVVEEVTLIQPDGRARHLIRHKRGVDIDGARYVVGVTLDVTAQRESSEQHRVQQSALVREMHHRVKNNLQGVVGLLRRHARTSDPKDMLHGAIAQVQSIATVHGLQGKDGSSGVELGDLTDAIAGGLAGLFGQRIAIGRDQGFATAHIGARDVVSVALILNELLTNAAKHARAPAASGLELKGGTSFDATVVVALHGDAARARVSIINPGRLPDGFDFGAGVEIGTGLSLVRTLLPAAGVELSFADDDDSVQVQMHLSAPVLDTSRA